jgi:hypothetical protein
MFSALHGKTVDFSSKSTFDINLNNGPQNGNPIVQVIEKLKVEQ